MRPRSHPAIVVAAALLVAAGGCGGDDEEKPKPSAGPAAPPESRALDDRSSGDEQAKAERDEEKKSKHKPRRPPRTPEEAVARLPESKRIKLVARAAKLVVKAYDFEGARTSVTGGGRSVSIALPPGQACKARPDEAERILARLKEYTTYARTVTITVGGQPLRPYLAANCKRASLPGRGGRTVFTKSGSGQYQGKSFKIRSKSWAIDYVNTGGFFQVFVFGKNSAPISTTKPGAGTQRYEGPGTFRITVSGIRDWTVRVRDGGR